MKDIGETRKRVDRSQTGQCSQCGYVVKLWETEEEKKMGKILCDRCGHIGEPTNVSRPFRGYWEY